MNEQIPMPLTVAEWDEVAAVPTVRENWQLGPSEGGSDLDLLTYGVKFVFVSDSSGYTGDVFVILSESLSTPPTVLMRRHGVLNIATF